MENTEEKCGARIIHHELVAKARERDLPEENVKRLVLLCKALADPGRLRLLHALLHQELCVCDLAAFLGNSESAVSHQLRNLRVAGIIDNRREGTVLYYRLVDEEVKRLLRTVCRQFHDQSAGAGGAGSDNRN